MCDEARDFALLVGVAEYSCLPQLDSSTEDVSIVRSWLLHPRGANLRPQDVLEPLAESQEYARSRIEEGFQEIFTRAREQGGARRLYLYFTGHGKSAGARDAHFCLPDWDHSGNRNSVITATPYVDCAVNSDLFEEVYVFFDCCRQRNAGGEIEACPSPYAHDRFEPSERHRGRVMGFATRDGHVARFSHTELGDKTPCSHFTKILVRGLMGAAARPDGGVEVGNLIKYVQKFTPIIARVYGDGDQKPDAWAVTIDDAVLGTTTPTRELRITLTRDFDNPLLLVGPDGDVLDRIEEPTTGQTLEHELPGAGLYMVEETETNESHWSRYVFGAEEPLDVRLPTS